MLTAPERWRKLPNLFIPVCNVIILKSKDEIAIMREAGKIAANLLLRLEEILKPGLTTLSLNQIAETWIREQGALPTFVGYQGYRHALCISINEQVVHGIPGDRRIVDGDLVSIDCGVTWKGFVADHAKTFCVGQVDKTRQELVQKTEFALHKGIEEFIVGNRVGDIGAAVEAVANQKKYGVVKDFVGHGVGRRMHEEPQVPNFGPSGTGPRLKSGLVLAIEPMFNLGTGEVQVLKDGWTVITKDGKPSAHFEHTIALTDNGPEVLTRP